MSGETNFQQISKNELIHSTDSGVCFGNHQQRIYEKKEERSHRRRELIGPLFVHLHSHALQFMFDVSSSYTGSHPKHNTKGRQQASAPEEPDISTAKRNEPPNNDQTNSTCDSDLFNSERNVFK